MYIRLGVEPAAGGEGTTFSPLCTQHATVLVRVRFEHVL